MDDQYDASSSRHVAQNIDPDLDGEESDNEDDHLDWTKLSATRYTLPKRGDKEFEPALQGETNLQVHALGRARDAMFDALSVPRSISHKSISYSVWYPRIARAHVTLARGVHFAGVGHSAPRLVTHGKDAGKTHKRLELLPEEALYLIERGNLWCWREIPGIQTAEDQKEDAIQGSPMSVQQAFSDMLGKESMTLARYQAYVYLKRLGFNVTRAIPPTPAYPMPRADQSLSLERPSVLSRLLRPFRTVLRMIESTFVPEIDWWKPVSFRSWYWFCGAHDYGSTCRLLRFIPSGRNAPLRVPPVEDPVSPYNIFYHVYKPNTPFKKSAPPAPDFYLVVIDAQTTPCPTLTELSHLWSSIPETGPPMPRMKYPPKPPPPPTLFQRLFPWLAPPATQKRKPHPFAVLKAGKKIVIIGVVDNGTIGFFRFGVGAFEEMPML